MNRRFRPRDPSSGRLYRVLGPRRALTTPPAVLRAVKMDNLAVVPANLLGLKGVWQAAANRLPGGQLLIILPKNASVRNALTRTADHLRSRGRRVTTVSAENFQ